MQTQQSQVTPQPSKLVSTQINDSVKSVSTATPIVQRPPESPVTATPSKITTLQESLEQFVSVKPIKNSSSHFTHEGVCTKCGWHTMQLSEQAARDLMRQHVQQHWRDVVTQVRG